jgi:hypothetical protein
VYSYAKNLNQHAQQFDIHEAHLRRCEHGFDLVYSYAKNLNQHAQQFDVREAHLRRREHRCDHCEVEIREARIMGMDTGTESGSE